MGRKTSNKGIFSPTSQLCVSWLRWFCGLRFLVLPFFDAIGFLFVFHYLVAALGSCFLCRQWSYPSSLSLIGSILLVALIFFDLTSTHRLYQFSLDPNQVYGKPRIIDVPDNEPYRLFYILLLAFFTSLRYLFKNHL